MFGFFMSNPTPLGQAIHGSAQAAKPLVILIRTPKSITIYAMRSVNAPADSDR
jgi:hypothetical protein